MVKQIDYRRIFMDNTQNKLPRYTKGEEIFNMVSHIVGGGLGVVALVLCVVFAALHRNTWGIVGCSIYGASLIILYTMSSIYHGLRLSTSKRVFQIIDHCTIYFLIAGTYTPFLLCALTKTRPVAAYITLVAVWGLTALAITLNAIDLSRYKIFSMICYVAIGWAIIFSIRGIYEALGPIGFALLFGGGCLYSGGIAFYALGKRKKYFHSIFHIFVLLGSITHALSVMFYVI